MPGSSGVYGDGVVNAHCGVNVGEEEIRMLSLETAKRLKKAGLVWEPETCDTYYWPRKFDNPVKVMHRDFDLLKKEQDTKGIVWAPRFDQLLAEIERREYAWIIGRTERKYRGHLYYGELANIQNPEDSECYEQFFDADTPEQAAAEALLWILEREQNCCAG